MEEKDCNDLDMYGTRIPRRALEVTFKGKRSMG
jgi:hypothetical protein